MGNNNQPQENSNPQNQNRNQVINNNQQQFQNQQQPNVNNRQQAQQPFNQNRPLPQQNVNQNQNQQQFQQSQPQFDPNSIQNQQTMNRLYSNNELQTDQYLDYYGEMAFGFYAGGNRSQPNLTKKAEISQKQTLAIKNDVQINKNSFKLIKNPQDKKIHNFTFKFTFEVEAAISIWYAAVETIDPLTNLTIIIDSQNQNYNPNRHYKFQPCKDFEYPLELYPLDMTAFKAEQLFQYNNTHFPLIIKIEKIDKSFENKSLYFYCTFLRTNEGTLNIKVIKQKLELNGQALIMNEVFGIQESQISNQEEGKECLICMTDKPDTIILPCNHMCLCFECCLDLRSKSNKCPMCRTAIKEYLRLTKAQIQNQQQQNFPQQ